MVMYDKEQFNKFQAKDKTEPQQSQLEPPDINWPITSHTKVAEHSFVGGQQ